LSAVNGRTDYIQDICYMYLFRAFVVVDYSTKCVWPLQLHFPYNSLEYTIFGFMNCAGMFLHSCPEKFLFMCHPLL
jgi:hypothetical protein